MSGANYIQGSSHLWGCDSHIDLESAKTQAESLGKDLVVFIGRKPYIVTRDGDVHRLAFLGNGALVIEPSLYEKLYFDNE